MAQRGTLVYVHGASDRSAQVADHVAAIEQQLSLAGMPYDVLASHWGEAEGARLDRIEASLPGTPAPPVSVPAEQPARAPLAELKLIAQRAAMDDMTSLPGRLEPREADRLLEICRSQAVAADETVTLRNGDVTPLAVACRAAAAQVAASEEYRLARASGAPEAALITAVGRAVGATVAAEASGPADLARIVQLRIAEAVLGAAGAAILAGYLGIDVGPDLKRWATDVLVPHRARIMRDAALGPADILLYQRHGDAIRQFVAGTIAEALGRGGPVIALGNSLGGVVLAETLSQPGAPRPQLMVTVGSQAPLLATFGALHALGRPGAPPPFQPWLNIYDRRDFLGFVAGPVWPGEAGILDREVITGFGFPDSHGLAYLRLADTYRAIREHPALSGDGPVDPPPRRFPIRIGARSRPVLWLFGVRGDNAYVDVGHEVDARFGFFRIRTPLANVRSWRIEGPWRWITAIGVRRSVRNGDITFGGNHLGGVRLDFREPFAWGPLRVPALYVTVGDLEGFAAALRARGVPGEDARG
jgi:hypothetical protein